MRCVVVQSVEVLVHFGDDLAVLSGLAPFDALPQCVLDPRRGVVRIVAGAPSHVQMLARGIYPASLPEAPEIQRSTEGLWALSFGKEMGAARRPPR